MPSTYDLKQKFSGLLRPFTNGLVRMGVTASAVYGALLYFWPDRRLLFLLFPVVLLLRMALNNIDGVIAREHDQKTRLGGYLNELGDLVLVFPEGTRGEPERMQELKGDTGRSSWNPSGIFCEGSFRQIGTTGKE